MLTPKTLRNFIDKIVVVEKSVRYSRIANQKTEIYYRDIGYLVDYTDESDSTELQYDFTMSETGELISV